METAFAIWKTTLIFLEVIFSFNLVIVVHELGHFFAARKCGLKVDKFSIWFGPALWKKSIDGVEFRIGCVPAGGFVSIPQMVAVKATEERTDCLPVISPWNKVLVACAGPFFSLLLAFFFAVVVWAVGRPVSEPETTTIVGHVEAGGPAANVGIQVGDKILSVDGHPVRRFTGAGQITDTVIWNVVRSEKPTIRIALDRGGKKLSFDVTPVIPQTNSLERKGLRQIGIGPAQLLIVADVFENSPAWQAGLRKRDIIIALNEQKVCSLMPFVDVIRKNNVQPLKLTIQRSEHIFSVTLVPNIPKGKQQLHLGILWDDHGMVSVAYPNPISQMVACVQTVWETLVAVISPKSAIKMQHLSGFVGIMRLYYLSFVAPEGWKTALWFSVILNVNIAILNLFPIPPLDGGHILLSLFEGIQRRCVRRSAWEKVQAVFTLLVIGFMLYLTFYDVQDLSCSWKNFGRMLTPDVNCSISP